MAKLSGYPGSQEVEVLAKLLEDLGYQQDGTLSCRFAKPSPMGTTYKVDWWHHRPNQAQVSKWEECEGYKNGFGSLEVVLNDPSSIEICKIFILNHWDIKFVNRREDWEALFRHLRQKK